MSDETNPPQTTPISPPLPQTERRLLYLFTRTPLHVGAGAGVGAIDQPIQRERHTGFPIIPGSTLKGLFADEMLRVVAYDVACPRRLRRVAEVCLDYGVRVQKSVFECWLDEDRFETFWRRLQETIQPKEDLVLAYTLDANAARRRRAAGNLAVVSEKRSHYVL